MRGLQWIINKKSSKTNKSKVKATYNPGCIVQAQVEVTPLAVKAAYDKAAKKCQKKRSPFQDFVKAAHQMMSLSAISAATSTANGAKSYWNRHSKTWCNSLKHIHLLKTACELQNSKLLIRRWRSVQFRIWSVSSSAKNWLRIYPDTHPEGKCSF